MNKKTTKNFLTEKLLKDLELVKETKYARRFIIII